MRYSRFEPASVVTYVFPCRARPMTERREWGGPRGAERF